MNKKQNVSLTIWGGICGIVGIACYISAIFSPLAPTALYVIAMAWPMLSVIFVFALYKYIALHQQSVANQLSLVFGWLGFAIVACMMSVQMAVNLGIEDQIADSPAKEELLLMVQQSVRFIDLGLDVAWDLFIGTSMIFLAIALSRTPRFRLWWGIPSAVLGILLIVLNVITFPNPPNTAGLFDIGPVVGLFITALGVKLLFLGIALKRNST